MIPFRVSPRIIGALSKRDLKRYFNNPTGYVFITLFIFLSAAAAFWRSRFFLNNLATLDQLNEMFPYLLLFFVPALTMGTWSEELKQGTDELLLTLPARETEVVLGKYLTVLGIYSAALLVSLCHVLVLAWLGAPDIGLMTTNYLGYWLAGACLIPVAMLASLLTSNGTIAFILGSLLCAVPIGLSPAVRVLSDSVGRRLGPAGMVFYFQDFAHGIVSMEGVLYFVLLAGFFLSVNVLVLGRRHWQRLPGHVPIWLHHSIRMMALVIVFASLIVLSARAHVRLDLTAERLHSLSAETRKIVAAIPADRPVAIQAFVSPEVPELLVQTRANLLSVLREIDAIGGGTVTVTVHQTEPYSEQARIARERYNLSPRRVPDSYTGDTEDVYLGVVVTCGPDEQMIPFFERGLSTEYEVVRAIRVVSRASRNRIGVIDSDVRIFGGIDFRDNEPRPQWTVLEELRKQYEVVEVTPASASTAKVDALLVVMPSRLTQSEMELVAEPIKRGVPTMILLDPLPAVDMRLAPAAPFAAQLNPYRQNPQSQMNFGDVRKMLIDLGINWVPARIAWDGYNPHPDMSQLPRETVFVGVGNGNLEAFNPHHPATTGLQEVLLLYPGYLLPTDTPGISFEPLLQTGWLSGTSSFFDLVRPSPTGLILNASLVREPDQRQYVLAAHLRGKAASSGGSEPTARPPNIIGVADLDFISDYFFGVRAMAPVNASFDNIVFFLNAIDVLVGDEAFIALRNRRVKHRTLERVEVQTRGFMERRIQEEQQAEKDARTALEGARNRLKQRLQEIDERRDLDVQAKQIMVRNLEEVENRRLRVLEANIDLTKNARIRASREIMEAQIRRIRGTIRTLAVLLPPIPVLLLGAVLFVRRERREREGARAARRLKNPND